jgi:hypothetical protein
MALQMVLPTVLQVDSALGKDPLKFPYSGR